MMELLNPEKIKIYKDQAPFYNETVELKYRLNEKKKTRKPFYLTLEEFDEIVKWKLTSQYYRQKYKRDLKITEEIAVKFTQLALNISHPDEEYEIYLTINVLRVIWGVNIGIASAILALCFPEKYAVIDFRVWRQIFSNEKRSFSIKDYIRYLREIRKLANRLDWDPQEVDLAIWALDEKEGV